MSFIFRRSTSSNNDLDKDRKDGELTANDSNNENAPQNANSEAELSNEKLSDSEKKPKKSRTTFLRNLVGNSSRNNSTSSLTSATSSSSSLNSALPPLPPIELIGYGPTVRHKLMDPDLASDIRNLIPARLQLFDNWYLVYSSEQHGISLNSLYRNSKPENQLIEYNKRKKAEKGFAESVVNRMMVNDASNSLYSTPQRRPQGYVLVIKDNHSSRFGAFLNENLKPVEHKRYYGNGECFLWKCERYDPTKLNHSKSSSSSKSKSAFRFKAFMYTGINDNIIYSNHDFIAIGSSQGQNGLYIDKSLCKGVSYPCETFGNEILCQHGSSTSKYGSFDIRGLEIWRIGDLE
ncbi:Oxr1 protein [Candida orthopsilosis Co 90-125]|uniref:Oxidation resistance protein 1 n=1 Tax=Candida orthopsilosis (strain 90-125) TaxID=1136231 RepID=H8X187_CANO9|nr:Oxr1 protein [Candida orthopsilosis Co 90-125]CCG22127.1 Oxr1 protein [Candida orthopsilosis Co 90-125]